MPIMKKVTKKSSGTRPAPKPKRNPSVPKGPPVDIESHADQLVGLTDPFSPQAANAQYPDAGAGRTLTEPIKFTYTLATDAQGEAVICFNPKSSFPLLVAATVAAGTATWPATFDAAGDFSTSLLQTYGRTCRPTSYGVRICNTLSATDSSGYLVIAKGGQAVLSTSTTLYPKYFTGFDTHPVKHGAEWHVSGKPRSSSAYAFKDITETNTNTSYMNNDWETIYIGLFASKASANVLFLEFVLNFEYTAREDAAIAAMAVPQPVLSVPMQTAVNHVQSQHPTSHKGTKDVVHGFIKKEAKKALLKHVIPFVTKKATAAIALA